MKKLESKVLKIAKIACKQLNIKPVQIKFNKNQIICFTEQFVPAKIYIQVDVKALLQDIKINNNAGIFTIIKLDSISKRFKFIILHEIGHYIQCYKYFKWYDKQHDTYITNGITSHDYRQQKIEKYADRIATYLMSKGI